MSADATLAVRGLGLRLPGVTDPGDLVRQITGDTAPPGAERRFAAADTDLEPIDRWVHGPVDVRLPEQLPTRGLRNWPYESLLALAAAAQAISERQAGPDPAAVLWASSTAGLTEYAAICTDAALLEPGLTSPIIAPAAAHNGPASTVSIRLGRTGPIESLIGGPTAGMSALVEAVRYICAGDVPRALVGASASISRWSLAGAADGFVPAEGAVCLAVEPWPSRTAMDGWTGPADGGAGPASGAGPAAGGAGPGVFDGGRTVTLRRARRVGLDPSRTAAALRDLVRAAGPPDTVVVSAPDVDLVDALVDQPVWHVERRLGDFAAAGGLLAVACAVAYCLTVPAPTDLLALAVEPSGNASFVEVSSSWIPTSSSGW